MAKKRKDIEFDDDEVHGGDGLYLQAGAFESELRIGVEVESADEESVDRVAEARARLSVADLLQSLQESGSEVALRDLFVLSDLTRAEMESVEAVWGQVPVARRRRVIALLVESAEEHIELQLGRLLRVALRDADATVRRLAIDGLWEEVDPSLIGPLVQFLHNDSDAGVRAAAARALGAFVLAGELDEIDAAQAMRAEQALLAIVANDQEPLNVQCRALESLAYSGEAGMRQLIENAYYAPEEEMRVSAVRAMGRSADTHWRGMVRAELSSPDAAMRAEAARACGELETKSATPQLLELLDDQEQSVRLAAIDALGHLGGKEARDALRALADAGDPEEAEAAEIALDELLFYDDAGAIPLLDEDDEDEDDADSEHWSYDE